MHCSPACLALACLLHYCSTSCRLRWSFLAVSRSASLLKGGITLLRPLQVSLRMSKELPLVVQYRIVDMGEIK